MKYSTFSLEGRMVSLVDTSESAELKSNQYEGDYSNFYLKNGEFIPKVEFPTPSGNFMDCGNRVPGDSLFINGIGQMVEGEIIIEFSESGEYEIAIDFLEYLQKTFTVIIP